MSPNDRRLLAVAEEHKAVLDAIATATGTKDRSTYTPADLPKRVLDLLAETERLRARVAELEAALLAVRNTAQTYRSSDPVAFDEILGQAARALDGGSDE